MVLIISPRSATFDNYTSIGGCCGADIVGIESVGARGKTCPPHILHLQSASFKHRKASVAATGVTPLLIRALLCDVLQGKLLAWVFNGLPPCASSHLGHLQLRNGACVARLRGYPPVLPSAKLHIL